VEFCAEAFGTGMIFSMIGGSKRHHLSDYIKTTTQLFSQKFNPLSLSRPYHKTNLGIAKHWQMKEGQG